MKTLHSPLSIVYSMVLGFLSNIHLSFFISNCDDFLIKTFLSCFACFGVVLFFFYYGLGLTIKIIRIYAQPYLYLDDNCMVIILIIFIIAVTKNLTIQL